MMVNVCLTSFESHRLVLNCFETGLATDNSEFSAARAISKYPFAVVDVDQRVVEFRVNIKSSLFISSTS